MHQPITFSQLQNILAKCSELTVDLRFHLDASLVCVQTNLARPLYHLGMKHTSIQCHSLTIRNRKFGQWACVALKSNEKLSLYIDNSCVTAYSV